MAKILDFLKEVVVRKASDLHLISGYPPSIRIDSELKYLNNEKLDDKSCEELVMQILSAEQKNLALSYKDLDFSYELPDLARFRINVYFQKGSLALSARYIPAKIKSIEELNLPQIARDFAKLRQGFVLITGPTGHGKSTTLSAIIQEINLTKSVHIITIEDPIEYVYPFGKSLISQRELNSDTKSWEKALRSALREDPDVVLVGEMRDFETISIALTIAETGHLVFATLHTNSAAQTIDRVVDVFPENAKVQARLQLANTLEAVVSQRLVPAIGGGRLPVCEIMLAIPAVRSTIRDGKTHLLDNIITTSRELGMVTLEHALMDRIKNNQISQETALSYSLHPSEFMNLIRLKR